jgi:hypothetical protein
MFLRTIRAVSCGRPVAWTAYARSFFNRKPAAKLKRLCKIAGFEDELLAAAICFNPDNPEWAADNGINASGGRSGRDWVRLPEDFLASITTLTRHKLSIN